MTFILVPGTTYNDALTKRDDGGSENFCSGDFSLTGKDKVDWTTKLCTVLFTNISPERNYIFGL